MMKSFYSFVYKTGTLFILLGILSCNKLRDFDQKPELESLQQGLKTSAAIGYCASIATSAYKGFGLPDNVIFDKSSGLIYIKIDRDHPLPFNKNIGDIIIAGQWNSNGGVMAILFANIDILGGNVKLYGLHLVPFSERSDGIWAMFAKQDIVLENGSDTILNLGNITDLAFNTQLDRLNTGVPTDAFVAVKQNVWFINIDQNKTYSNVYDDDITITGGGQIVEAKGASGGILYHAMLDTKVNYSECTLNPVSGYAFLQNFKAGGTPYIDLGNSLLSFHNSCDGKVHVDFSSGKYVGYNGKYISLDIP
jgi:hypothetical protein